MSSPDALIQHGVTPCTLKWNGSGKKPVLALDMGAPSVGGYAVFNVLAAKGRPVLRLAYANHPDGLGEKGCFSRETSARYLGPDFDIPVLPGNINRHEIYSIGRTGIYVAPLIQGQERYVRVQLDTPGEVSLGSLEIVNADVFSTEPRRGSFRCSDDRLTRLWDISVWTCQLASFPNHDAWRIVAGRLLPRKLEQRRGDGIFKQRKETCKHAAGLRFGGTSLHHRAYMNILLWKTLIDASSIAAALGHGEEASAWRSNADHFSNVIRKTFWNDKKGYFRLSAEDGKIGFEANALALATHFVTPQEAVRIMPQLKYNGHGKFQALAARGKFEYGDAAGGLKALDDHGWYKLLDPSWKGALTVTECMHLHRRGWGDESHPDTAIAGIYSAYILGIEPISPGFKQFVFRPQMGGLTFAEGIVPTPFGEIRARWEKKGEGLSFTLTVPPGTTAEFVWRDQRRVLQPGTHTF